MENQELPCFHQIRDVIGITCLPEMSEKFDGKLHTGRLTHQMLDINAPGVYKNNCRVPSAGSAATKVYTPSRQLQQGAFL